MLTCLWAPCPDGDPGLRIPYPGSRILDPTSWIQKLDPGSWIQDVCVCVRIVQFVNILLWTFLESALETRVFVLNVQDVFMYMICFNIIGHQLVGKRSVSFGSADGRYIALRSLPLGRWSNDRSVVGRWVADWLIGSRRNTRAYETVFHLCWWVAHMLNDYMFDVC